MKDSLFGLRDNFFFKINYAILASHCFLRINLSFFKIIKTFIIVKIVILLIILLILKIIY